VCITYKSYSKFSFYLYIYVQFVSAEKFLESVEVNKNYPLLLLHLVDKSDVNITIRIAGAVAFKNYVKRNWKVVGFYFVYSGYIIFLFILLFLHILYISLYISYQKYIIMYSIIYHIIIYFSHYIIHVIFMSYYFYI